jgi:inosose dehydratase
MGERVDRRTFVRRTAMAGLGLASADAVCVAARGDIRFGYAAITWGGQDRQAIEDVSAVGFKGIQLRTSALPEFGDKPAALKELLAKHRLTMVAFSSGNVRIDPAFEAEDLATHLRHARFVRDVGGLYLQLTDTRPKRALVAADYQRLGWLMTEIGKRTADLGVPVAYHNHMNNIGERPEEVDRVLEAADPRYVKVLLDIAHYQQGGGDPVKAVRQFSDRLLFLHIKDVQPVGPSASRDGGSPSAGNTGDPRSYRFVELGRGTVDIKGVFAALDQAKFRGWAIVELDAVPDKARTPREAAIIARTYLQQLGFTV